MSGRTKAATRVLIVLAGTLVAVVVAEFVTVTTLGRFVAVDAQGRYRIDLLKGDGQWLAIANLSALITFAVLTALVVKIVYWRRPFDRTLVLLGGYAGACIAAGLALLLVYAIGYAGGASSMVGPRASGGAAGLGALSMATLMTSVYVGVFALPSTLPVIIYTESRGVRSPLFHGIAGVVSALVALGVYLAVFLLAGAPPKEIFRSADLVAGWLVLFGAPGVVGGLTYWLIAGRTAGERRTSIATTAAG